jgi:large subunit ribosomal protein L24
MEAAIPACKVMLVCPKCKKPTRVGHTMTTGEKARKVRTCKKCGAAFEN